jgi:hypothetical protein
MYGDNPPIPTTTPAQRAMHRATRIQGLLAELDRRESMAVAALPSTEHHFGSSHLQTDSGLTEPQEDFVDYWAPQRVIDECRVRRDLISAVLIWSETNDEDNGSQLDRVLADL